MPPHIRLAVISECPLYREGLSSLLRSVKSFNVIYEGDFGDLEELGARQADILLFDVGTVRDRRAVQDALSASRQSTPIVVIGIGENVDEILGWLEAGASGYVSRREVKEALMETVRNVAAGTFRCSPEISAGILKWGQELEREVALHSDRLTNRERQIQALKALRLTNQEIATRLNIDVSTVKNHLHNIRKKERERLPQSGAIDSSPRH